MPALKNPRHESFCQHRAAGKTMSEAYELAGYKPDRKHAARLATKGDIEARIAELQAPAAQKAQVDIARVLLELTRIGTVDPRRLLGPVGVIKPPKEWDDDLAAAVASIEVLQEPAVGKRRAKLSYKVRLWDKNVALDKIAKHLGMFVDRSVVTMNHNYALMTEEELRFEIAAIHAEARSLKAGVQH
jgi:phage terminase small subunit